MGRRAPWNGGVGVPAPAWVPALAALLGCGTPGAAPSVELEPLVVRGPTSAALAPVAFLAGCWWGWSASGTTVIEERWGPPSENVMLGTTRYLRDGVTVGFEFAHVEAAGDGIVLTPYPGGERSAHSFRLTSSGPGQARFEAPEHDDPKRITYRLVGEGRLEARIDGGPEDPEPRGWTLDATPCEGLPAI